ncbi:hypothetical protein GNP80_10770 [Aliivibrio fischeri]|uniref:hypothetical protein n=1 Tax=Aliivibrio fischeri TaxID=668 RepID=UPI0012D89733|nr:hypothetical protein [Aliivibrio fischeri]MUK92926.1 hypothetical protein [Aliivibrio fischeri]
MFSTTKTNKNHPQRHFSIPITTIALQNSHRLTTCASTPATACKAMVPVCSSFQRGAKAWVVLDYQPLPQAWGTRTSCQLFSAHLVCKKRKQSASTIGIEPSNLYF